MPRGTDARQTATPALNQRIDRGHGEWTVLEAANQGRVEVLKSCQFVDDFFGDAIEDAWQQLGDGAGAFAISAGIGGLVAGTTASGDNYKVELAHNLNWAANRAAIFETRVTLSAITTVGVCVGLTDAVSEAATKLAYADSTGRVLVADDCVLIGFDTDDATYTNWTALAGKATVAATPVDLTDTPVAATYNVLRIELDTSGNADFYVDGTYRGSIATALTVTDPLTPYVGIINRANAITRTVTCDYVAAYQRRTA